MRLLQVYRGWRKSGLLNAQVPAWHAVTTCERAQGVNLNRFVSPRRKVGIIS